MTRAAAPPAASPPKLAAVFLEMMIVGQSMVLASQCVWPCKTLIGGVQREESGDGGGTGGTPRAKFARELS